MILDFIALIFIVLVNVVLITSIFNFTRANVDDTSNNAIAIDISELVVLLVVLLLCIYKILYKLMDGASHLFIMILAFVLIVLFWSISRVPMVRNALGIKEGVDYPDLNDTVADKLNNNRVEEEPEENEPPATAKECGIKLPDKNEIDFGKYEGKRF